MTEVILSNPGNWSVNRDGHKIIRGYFHRTAVKGDTAVGEGEYFHNHCVKASFDFVIDLNGKAIESVMPKDTAWAVNEWDENEISVSIEFTGLNGTPLRMAQINGAIQAINQETNLRRIAKHRLSISEIPQRLVSGWGNHKDVTVAYNIAGGHTDGITETEIQAIFNGIVN